MPFELKPLGQSTCRSRVVNVGCRRCRVVRSPHVQRSSWRRLLWRRSSWWRAMVVAVVTVLLVIIGAEGFPIIVAPSLLLVLPLMMLCDDDVLCILATIDVAASVSAFVLTSSIL